MSPNELLPKRKDWWKSLFKFIIMCFLLFILAHTSHAQDNIIRKGFTFGTSLGYGSIKYEHQNMPTKDDSFAFGLKVGYAITQNIISGLEVNGWTIQAFNDYAYNYYYYYDYNEPSEGESISNISLFINMFPFKERPFYIIGGVGKTYYDNYDQNADIRETGTSFSIGCGYEIPISEHWRFAPQYKYSKGNFTGGEYRVSEISIAFHWYSGR